MAEENDYDFEIDLYEDILAGKPDLVAALIPLGHAYTGKGLYDKALDVDIRLVGLRPDDAIMRYNLACDYSLLKSADKSLETLEQAIALGYREFEYMRKDPDLEFVRKDPRFAALVNKVAGSGNS